MIIMIQLTKNERVKIHCLKGRVRKLENSLNFDDGRWNPDHSFDWYNERIKECNEKIERIIKR